MRNALAAAAMAICIPASSALAAEGLPVPEHDVDRACATLKDKAMIANCVRDEQDRYDFIQSAWDNLSPSRQREASVFARNQGPNNYAFYKTLALFVSAQIEMQQQANDATGPTPRFQR